MAEYQKCTKKPDGYADTLCDAMSITASVRRTKKSKGIFASCMVNMNTGERLGMRIEARTQNMPDGVVFNICPFCGGELRDTSND